MLTVTQNAVTEIRNLTDQPQAPEGGGVRIATDPTGALSCAWPPRLPRMTRCSMPTERACSWTPAPPRCSTTRRSTP